MKSTNLLKLSNIFLLVVLAAGSVCRADQRPFTPADQFRIREFGNFAMSPDGKYLAYTTDGLSESRPLTRTDNAELYVASTSDSSEPMQVKLPDGTAKGLSQPQWSPDSKYLAFTSAREGFTTLWVLDRATRNVTQVSAKALAVDSFNAQCFVWIDDQRLALTALPPNQLPRERSLPLQGEITPAGIWRRSVSGKEATVSVLDTDGDEEFARRPLESLVIAEVPSMKNTVVFSSPQLCDLRPSPGGKALLVLSQTGVQRPNPTGPDLIWGAELYTPVVVRFDGGKVTANTINGRPSVLNGSLQWSPDGSEFSALGGSRVNPQVFRFTMDSYSVVRTDKVDPLERPCDQCISVYVVAGPVWLDSTHLAVRGRLDGAGRYDWWLLNGDADPVNLTSGSDAPPATVYRVAGMANPVGVSGGRLVALKPSGLEPLELKGVSKTLSSVVVTGGAIGAPDVIHGDIIVDAGSPSEPAYYSVYVAKMEAAPIGAPLNSAKLTAYSSATGSAAFTQVDRTGSYLFTTASNAKPKARVELNTFLRDVKEGEAKAIHYKSLRGEDLVAWVVLPVDYKAGQRYPFVIEVYEGYSVRENVRGPYVCSLNEVDSRNLQVLSSNGYGFVIPSMPMAKGRTAESDPYLELTDGIDPLVDKLVELGYADRERMGVMGHSFGGYSVCGLIEQTNKFKAAVELAGVADLISEQYSMFPGYRYQDYATDEVGYVVGFAPPWTDPERYVRNSALYHADKAMVPLLLLHGDMDGIIPIQQAEEFYYALWQAGKKARFVRYWGEEHVFTGKANVENQWKEILGWFDKYLKADVK